MEANLKTIQRELKSVQHLNTINIHDEYETPDELLKEACWKYNVKPVLDVCCTKNNKKYQKCFTKNEDGLKQQWKEDFFMNPPYSEVNKWIAKAYNEHIKNNVTCIALVYAKTDTRWWHRYVERKAEVHFIQGRIHFLTNGKRTANSAPYPSCWIIWRSNS